MNKDDIKVHRILTHLRQAITILSSNKKVNPGLSKLAFEAAEDQIETALNICHREVGDRDFGK